MYPVEIWEEILKNLNAKDLGRCRRVSKTWDAIIGRILDQDVDVWYRQCVEDIPQTLWSSLLEHHMDQDIECHDLSKARINPTGWQEMYKSWQRWHGVVQKTPQIGTLEPLPSYRPLERITCVAALSNIIAVGSSEGIMTFYDITIDRILYRADHAEHLKDVKLFHKGALVVGVSVSKHDRIRFWNLEAKKEETLLRCIGSLITTSFANCFIIINNYLYLLRLSEHLSDNLLVQKWNYREIVTQGDQIVAVRADANQVTLRTEKKFLLVNCEIEDAIDVKCGIIKEPEVLIRYYRIFKARVTACIGVYGEFGFSIDGGRWKIYNLLGKLGAPVTTVVFHVAVLALGLQSGAVHLVRIKDVESLRNLDFDTIESKTLLLDREAIISLNVTEYNSAQYLVASSNKHVHLVKLT